MGEKLTLKQLAMVQLAPYQYSVIIGLMLSDGWITFGSKTSKNARLGFKQSANHASYVFFVFNILSHYCNSIPRGTTRISLFHEEYSWNNKIYATTVAWISAGKWNNGLGFFTRSMPCITKLHPIFRLLRRRCLRIYMNY